MTADTGRTAIDESARTLGVRREYDIEVDVDGMVSPGHGGMSVCSTVKAVPSFRKGPAWGGTGKDPVWGIDVVTLGKGLQLVVDPREPQHLLIEPAHQMSYEAFLALLHATRDSWRPAVEVKED